MYLCIYVLLGLSYLNAVYKYVVMQIEPGPVYAQLKNGESIKLADGRSIDPLQVCSKPQKGKVFLFIECQETLQTIKAVCSSLYIKLILN